MKSEICMNCADKSCYGYDHRITECEDFQPMTNADRIRGMTDEGIEDWYWWMHKEMMRYTDSRVFVHDWLKSPVEEEERQ